MFGLEGSRTLLAHHFHLLVVRQQFLPCAYLLVVVVHHIFVHMQRFAWVDRRRNEYVGAVLSKFRIIRRERRVILQFVGRIDDRRAVFLILLDGSGISGMQQGIAHPDVIRQHFVLNMTLGIDELRTKTLAYHKAVKIADDVTCRVGRVALYIHAAGVGEDIVGGLTNKYVASGTLRTRCSADGLRHGVNRCLRARA